MHIGIILDGNRRFAKRLMKEPCKGHEYGVEKVEKLLDWCIELGVKQLTLYTLSVDNFNKRPEKELSYLLNLFKKEASNLLDDKKIHENKIRVRFIGRLHMFDKELQDMMYKLMDQTKQYGNLTVNFAMAYGGREEITDAVKKMIEQGVSADHVDMKTISKYLYMSDEPDLIIRTGGEKRSSDFLTFQGAYSELIFLDILWPEFTKEDLISCIEEFNERERRFGK